MEACLDPLRKNAYEIKNRIIIKTRCLLFLLVCVNNPWFSTMNMPCTLKNWTETLERLGFVERLNARVYRMKLESIPELLNVVVKSGQKRLM